MFDDADRESFFEAARAQAQREFEGDNTNAQALVRWGGALLELAHYKQGSESIDMIKQAIVKLKKALELDSGKADAEWCLGNAYTSLGFLCPDKVKAQEQFNQASESFRKCLAKEPNNDTYKKAIEMCDKAPEYYDEIQSHLNSSGMAGPGGPGMGPGMEGGPPGREKPSSNDFWWDVGGFVVLGAVLVGALFIARASAKSAPA